MWHRAYVQHLENALRTQVCIIDYSSYFVGRACREPTVGSSDFRRLQIPSKKESGSTGKVDRDLRGLFQRWGSIGRSTHTPSR